MKSRNKGARRGLRGGGGERPSRGKRSIHAIREIMNNFRGSYSRARTSKIKRQAARAYKVFIGRLFESE
jgi:hypothetical protein